MKAIPVLPYSFEYQLFSQPTNLMTEQPPETTSEKHKTTLFF